MTDTASKPAWIRHKPGCGQRVFNDPIDIDQHRRYCPADIIKRIKTLEDQSKDALERLDTIENAEPETDLDLDAVADWPDSDTDDEPVQQSTYVDDGYAPITTDPDINTSHFGGSTSRPTL